MGQEPPLLIKLVSVIGFTMYTRHTMNMLGKNPIKCKT